MAEHTLKKEEATPQKRRRRKILSPTIMETFSNWRRRASRLIRDGARPYQKLLLGATPYSSTNPGPYTVLMLPARPSDLGIKFGHPRQHRHAYF